jgi:hypothetical protein
VVAAHIQCRTSIVPSVGLVETTADVSADENSSRKVLAMLWRTPVSVV